MSEFQTVIGPNDFRLTVRKEVMEVMHLRPYQRITEAQAWQVIELNAAAFDEEMDIRREQGLNAPDTSALKKK